MVMGDGQVHASGQAGDHLESFARPSNGPLTYAPGFEPRPVVPEVPVTDNSYSGGLYANPNQPLSPTNDGGPLAVSLSFQDAAVQHEASIQVLPAVPEPPSIMMTVVGLILVAAYVARKHTRSSKLEHPCES